MSQAVVVAFGVRAHGHREIFGVDVGHSETEALWKQFLTELTDGGLHGVHLVISDAHKGFKTAIQVTLQGSTWQRCRVHFLRNALSTLPQGRQEMIPSLIRTIFSQPDAEYVHHQHAEVVRMLERIHPETADLLADAKEDLLAFTSFPRAHWRQIWSTNPLERLNRDIKRRTDVVGVFPNPEALLWLTTAVLMEQHDEWAASNRRYLSEESLKTLTNPDPLEQQVARQLNIASSMNSDPHTVMEITPPHGTSSHPGPWKTVEELELATLGWVHWHNQDRLHGFIGDVPPAEFEETFYAE